MGYDDFSFWSDLDGEGWRLVSRLKKNSPITIVTQNEVPTASSIVFDKMV
ncbi:hypothetical protein [Geminicoccus harenae]|nr:hypothetical protein [Geminicoccus harenae]